MICAVAKAGAEDVDRAVKAAQAALEGEWSQLPASGRERLMHKLADLVEANNAASSPSSRRSTTASP